ncbi:MAG: class I SAM-dependent methyltransferase [Candidatus Heimdallarchaeaceae archaeon]|jgi:cyclopropane fatty-acyl-phospholipid synthase-like methyltransferase
MNPEEDVYGQMIWAYYNGKEVCETAERDDGYITRKPLPRIYFSSYEEWAPYEKIAMDYVKGKVLDIGCGAGRHSLYLQEKDFDVLGIDNSPLAIKVCRLRGLRKAKVLSLDEVRFNPGSFDTIIMMGNNFGLFGNFDNAKKMLRRFCKITSKDGLIIAETRDPYQTDNPAHLDYQELNRERGRMSGQIRIRVRFNKYTTPWFDYLLVSQEEMKKIIKSTGWKVNKFIESQGDYIAILHKKLIKM